MHRSRFDTRRPRLPRRVRRPVTYWYHVTYNGRLDGIARRGLRTGQARSIGAPALDHHAKKGTFLTAADGVFFWHSRAEAFAEHSSDNFVEDELIPVVLRVRLKYVQLRDAQEDTEGARDAMADAIIVKDIILPEQLEVFTGERWVPIDEYDEVLVDRAYRTEVEEPEQPDGEDGEEDWDGAEPEELHYFREESPLIPPECRP